MREESLTQVAALLQSTGDFDMSLFPALSEACVREIAAVLRPGKDPEQDIPHAYALAVSLLMRARAEAQGTAPTAYTLGDLSVTEGTSGERAAQLRREAFRLLKGYVSPAGFAFVGVGS